MTTFGWYKIKTKAQQKSSIVSKSSKVACIDIILEKLAFGISIMLKDGKLFNTTHLLIV